MEWAFSVYVQTYSNLPTCSACVRSRRRRPPSCNVVQTKTVFIDFLVNFPTDIKETDKILKDVSQGEPNGIEREPEPSLM